MESPNDLPAFKTSLAGHMPCLLFLYHRLKVSLYSLGYFIRADGLIPRRSAAGVSISVIIKSFVKGATITRGRDAYFRRRQEFGISHTVTILQHAIAQPLTYRIFMK